MSETFFIFYLNKCFLVAVNEFSRRLFSVQTIEVTVSKMTVIQLSFFQLLPHPTALI